MGSLPQELDDRCGESGVTQHPNVIVVDRLQGGSGDCRPQHLWTPGQRVPGARDDQGGGGDPRPMAMTRRPAATSASTIPGRTQVRLASTAKPWCSRTGGPDAAAPHSWYAISRPSVDVKVLLTRSNLRQVSTDCGTQAGCCRRRSRTAISAVAPNTIRPASTRKVPNRARPVFGMLTLGGVDTTGIRGDGETPGGPPGDPTVGPPTNGEGPGGWVSDVPVVGPPGVPPDDP